MKNNKVRVLVVGIGQSNFLKQLYHSIHLIAPNKFEFDVVGLKELSGKDEYDFKVFKSEFAIKSLTIQHSLTVLLKSAFYRLVFKLFLLGAPIKLIRSVISNFLNYARIARELKVEQYHVVHYHFVQIPSLLFLWNLKKGNKCVLSFWGSDLMRSSGLINYYLQQQALTRANIITVQSAEMKMMVMAKFGVKLQAKIKIARFPPYEKLYDLIKINYLNRNACQELLAAKFQYPVNKKWIVVGHNGSAYNNHLEIVSTLGKLGKEIKNEVYIILPFTYKHNDEYERQISQRLADLCLSGSLLRSFLSWEDLAMLKCATEIMIHLPQTDALSGALTEALYAGAKVITGDWLPYGPFRKAGLEYETISDINELPDLVERLLQTSIGTDKIASVQKFIERHFFARPCAEMWLPLLNPDTDA